MNATQTSTAPAMITRKISEKIAINSSNQAFLIPTTHFYVNLLNHCLYLKSLNLAKTIHSQLIRTGLHRQTFLGNCLVNTYSKCGAIQEAFHAFEDIQTKNPTSWNVILAGFFRIGWMENACQWFDEMPERDAVSWNSMISGYASNGCVESALRILYKMQESGVRPTGYTFSIVTSTCVSSPRQGKQIHGSIIRNNLNLNLVLNNSLMDMYGKFRIMDYAFNVFLGMEELDVESWNTMISGCDKTDGKESEFAFTLFKSMRVAGFLPDQYTLSTVVSVCANLNDLEKGKQVFALSIRTGFIYNSIVSSAVVDMFAKCNRLEDSAQLFEEMAERNSALCNSMISGYARLGFAEEALHLFVLTTKENLRPTGFTFASVVTSASSLIPMEQGTQLHSLIIKSGFELDEIVACSLMDMYAKSGLIDSSIKIFYKMVTKDLISWNTMITGLARNGQAVQALLLFNELCEKGPQPDRITLAGILSACSHGGLISQGRCIFLSMEEKLGVPIGIEHYSCMVDMMGRAGMLNEAMEMIESMPFKPNSLIWGLLLEACTIIGDIRFAERVSERVMELRPKFSLPYLVLEKMYMRRCQWESVVRVRKAMRERGVKKVCGRSWIGIKNQVAVFKTNQIIPCGGKATYSVLRLLVWEIMQAGYAPQDYAGYGDE